MIELNKIYCGDALTVLKTWPDSFVQCVVTSPPYWGLRDYGVKGQLGLEKTPEEYVAKMVDIFREVRRVLRDDGTLWLNLGDSYNSNPSNNQGKGIENSKIGLREGARSLGRQKRNINNLKPKDLVGIPWTVAFALRADGWYLRQDIIWHKPNPMPESVTDRCTKSHEYIFLLAKSQKYYYDAEAIKEPASYNTHERVARAKIDHKSNPSDKISGIRPRKLAQPGSGIKNNDSFDSAMAVMPDYRNKRSVWTVTTKPYSEAHFATFPEDLIKPCILAGCPENGIVLDPFAGALTTAKVARDLNRCFLCIELNPEYIKMGERRLSQQRLQI